MVPKIIVHGGARGLSKHESVRQQDVVMACGAAYEVLRARGALDAVEEADPTYGVVAVSECRSWKLFATGWAGAHGRIDHDA